ncbi:hypothetical protein RBB82_00530 [Tunturiibacter lichenicola]
MGVEVGWVGGDCATVGGFGLGGLVERVLGEGQIVEEVGVGGIFCGEGGEEFEGGGVVLLVEGFVGLGAEGILGGCFGGGRWCRWCLRGVGRGRSRR